MEENVGQRGRLQPRKGRDRVARDVADHVVPPEELVQDDAVHEAAEAQAEEDARRPPWLVDVPRCVVVMGLPYPARGQLTPRERPGGGLFARD